MSREREQIARAFWCVVLGGIAIGVLATVLSIPVHGAVRVGFAHAADGESWPPQIDAATPLPIEEPPPPALVREPQVFPPNDVFPEGHVAITFAIPASCCVAILGSYDLSHWSLLCTPPVESPSVSVVTPLSISSHFLVAQTFRTTASREAWVARAGFTPAPTRIPTEAELWAAARSVGNSSPATQPATPRRKHGPRK